MAQACDANGLWREDVRAMRRGRRGPGYRDNIFINVSHSVAMVSITRENLLIRQPGLRAIFSAHT